MTSPRYSRRHYQDVAEILEESREDSSLDSLAMLDHLINEFAGLFADDNDRFDINRFLIASGVSEEFHENYFGGENFFSEYN